MAASLLPDSTMFFSLPSPLHFFFGSFLAYLPFVFPLSSYIIQIICNYIFIIIFIVYSVYIYICVCCLITLTLSNMLAIQHVCQSRGSAAGRSLRQCWAPWTTSSRPRGFSLSWPSRATHAWDCWSHICWVLRQGLGLGDVKMLHSYNLYVYNYVYNYIYIIYLCFIYLFIYLFI